MPLPEEGQEQVRRFVASLNADMPPHVAGPMRYEARSVRNAIGLFEVSPVDYDDPNSGEYEVEFARLRFTRSRGWELYWSDRNSTFHVYEDAAPTMDVRDLITEINADPTGIFFG